MLCLMCLIWGKKKKDIKKREEEVSTKKRRHLVSYNMKKREMLHRGEDKKNCLKQNGNEKNERSGSALACSINWKNGN